MTMTAARAARSLGIAATGGGAGAPRRHDATAVSTRARLSALPGMNAACVVEARILERHRAQVRAGGEQPREQRDLFVEQAAVVRVDEAITGDLAARQVDLEAGVERQPVELVEQRFAALAAPPPPRQQVRDVQGDRRAGLLGQAAEEVVGVHLAQHQR